MTLGQPARVLWRGGWEVVLLVTAMGVAYASANSWVIDMNEAYTMKGCDLKEEIPNEHYVRYSKDY